MEVMAKHDLGGNMTALQFRFVYRFPSPRLNKYDPWGHKYMNRSQWLLQRKADCYGK